MANACEYLDVLEKLKLPPLPIPQSPSADEAVAIDKNEQPENERLDYNIELLKNYCQDEPSIILKNLLDNLQIRHLNVHHCLGIDNNITLESLYALHLQNVLLDVMENVNFESCARDELISVRHLKLCAQAIIDLAKISLERQLHVFFYESGVFDQYKTASEYCGPPNYALLQVAIAFMAKVTKVKQFNVGNTLEKLLQIQMAGVFSIVLAFNLRKLCPLDPNIMSSMQQKLNFLWLTFDKTEYFRNLLFFKAKTQSFELMQKLFRQELLHRLKAKSGFGALVATIRTSQASIKSYELEDKHAFEVVANIVTNRGHTKRFQLIMIDQIFKFLNDCLLDERLIDNMGAGLLTLRRLYDMSDENQKHIKFTLNDILKYISEPEDLLTGLIIMDNHKITILVSFFYNLFCTSSVECLPSELILSYLPMFLQMFYYIPPNFIQKKQLAAIIVRCLHNQPSVKLQEIIDNLYTADYDMDWKLLHERLIIQPNPDHTELLIKVATSEYKPSFDISLALPELLMSEEHHILTYQVFLILIKLMSKVLNGDIDDEWTAIDLLQSEDELVAYLNSKYPLKIEVMLSLNALISHQPLRAQIAENVDEFLNLLRQLLDERLGNRKRDNEGYDQALLIMLTLTQELLESTKTPELYQNFIPTFEKLKQQSPNQLVKNRINSLVSIIKGDWKKKINCQEYEMARTMIESQESHLQVYGIQMLLDLLRRKDESVMENGHVIIALALTTLKSKESFTFLNCARLFVALTYAMESEVLEILAGEYGNEHADIDFRLVVGECLVRVGKELGPLCYKYKNVLINCFMHGARSKHDEFRMSSYANLAQMCRTIAYQVHNFFQELVNMVDCELITGNYLPAKRAAVLVLSELLEGMDELYDFEEMLLPLYRLLKILEESENTDEKIRMHAANGLKSLNEKCQQFLFPEQQLEKDIKIFGINEPSRSNSGGSAGGGSGPSILELN